jgi:hypothetical protein
MWKDAVVAWFKALPRHLPGGTEKNHNCAYDRRYSARFSQQEFPEYKSKVLVTEPACSVYTATYLTTTGFFVAGVISTGASN